MVPLVKSGFLVDAASVGGSEHANEDIWNMRHDVFWVLDGATAVDGSHRFTVADYVQILNEALYEQAAGQDSLQQILRAAIQKIVDHPIAPAGYSATVAMAKKTAVGWEWLVLGDAAVVVQTARAKPKLISDDRLALVAPSIRAERRKVQGRPEEAERFEELSIELGLMRNTPEGFWVAAANPEAADHAICGVAAHQSEIFLMSDGVTDGLNIGYWTSLDTAIKDWKVAGVEAALQRMRDGLMIRKETVDDATLVGIRDNP